MNINIGDKIKEIRTSRGYSTYDLSEKTGIPQSTISKLENNKRRFDIEVLNKIASALEVSLSALLDEKESIRYLNRFYPIAQIVRNFRENKNLTQEEFAQKIKVDVRFIERLERGLNPYGHSSKEVPTVVILNRIAKVVNLSLEQLSLDTGYYDNYDDFMEHRFAVNLILPLVKYLKENEHIIKDRIVSFLEEYGYDYIEDNFTFEEAKDFYLNEIIDYGYKDISAEIEELGLNYNTDIDGNINYFPIKEDKYTKQKEYIESIKLDSAGEAMKFILQQPSLMAFGGYDLNDMSEEEIMDLANDMLFAMRLSLEKHRRK